MSLNHYRSSAPETWGTQNYRFGYPQQPLFRPQPSWGGQDYYHAHALNPDPAHESDIYNRIRHGGYDAEGVGLHEARHWHRQAYGGFRDIRDLSSREIGHAAAYEAYRIWIHNNSISDGRADFGQRREAFIALAVAEVSHIFPAGQVHERRKFRQACETAAATASTVFHALDDDGHSTASSYLSPGSSFHRSGSTSSDDLSDELYAFDERVMPRGSHRHRRRSSSVSFSSRPTLIPPNVSPYHPPSAMPIPIGQPSYSHSGGSPYQPGSSPYQPGSSPYQPGSTLYQPGSSPYSNPSPYIAAGGYAQQYPGSLPTAMGGPFDPNQNVHYPNSGSYPQQTYVQPQPGMTQGVPMPPGSTIIIQQPTHSSSSRHKHHKHRSSSRRRHRSQSDVYPVY